MEAGYVKKRHACAALFCELRLYEVGSYTLKPAFSIFMTLGGGTKGNGRGCHPWVMLRHQLVLLEVKWGPLL